MAWERPYRDGLAQSSSAELDALLRGGIDRGTSVLLMGPAGSGKTTMSSPFMVAALLREEYVVVYLFEESRETFLARSTGLGLNFTPYLEMGRFELVQVDLAELSPGEFSSRVRHAVENHQAAIIVLDSLNGYMNGMPSEQFLVIHMHELLSYLSKKGVATMLTVAQHGIMGSAMQTPIDVSFLADTVILLRYFEAMGTVRQAVSVVEKRRGGHERTIREMRITSSGSRVGDVLADFQGVLTSVPQYRDHNKELLVNESEH